MQPRVFVKDIRSLLAKPVHTKSSASVSVVKNSDPSWYIKPKDVEIDLEENVSPLDPKPSTSFQKDLSPSWYSRPENDGVLIREDPFKIKLCACGECFS